VKAEARPLPGERLFRKTVNSAFIGTGLEPELRALGVPALAIVGLTTNHCISTTARMASNLGFATFVASDATAAFDHIGLNGEMRSAEDVHHAALSDLKDEFADIVDSHWLIDALK
jgi:nicotinamidase-related amidase